jgi:membrane protein
MTRGSLPRRLRTGRQETTLRKPRDQPQLSDNIGITLTDRPSSSTVAAPGEVRSEAPAGTTKSYSGLLASTVKYLLRTEVHTFAFSVAANAILSFFPFVLLLLMLIRRVFRSPAMYEVVVQLLRDYLPAGQDFVIRNLNALVGARHRAQLLSLLILLVTSTGIFMPLEVALNRVWRFPNNRSYLGNQLISLGLTFSCGVLALLSIALTARNEVLLKSMTFGHDIFAIRMAGFAVMKVSAIVASIAIFFLIYWLLPNGKVPARAVLPAAVIMGLLSEILKYAYIVALPHLNFQEVYGPFALSVSLMFWAFLSGLLLLTGAYLSAQRHQRRKCS